MTFARVIAAAEERYSTPSYCYDNRIRPETEVLVIQRTMSGEAFFEDASGCHPVPAGHAMLFSHAEASRYGYPPKADAPYVLRFISFPPATALRAVFDRLRSDFGPVVSLPAASAAALQFDEILERYRRRTFLDMWQESELLFSLIISLYREQITSSRKRDPVEFGRVFLRNRFRSPINLKQVAAECGISREHFIRRYKTRFNESPGAFLRRLRLEHARAMLHATSMPVEEVALASGFASVNGFGRAFRARYGCSPGRAERHGLSKRRR